MKKSTKRNNSSERKREANVVSSTLTAVTRDKSENDPGGWKKPDLKATVNHWATIAGMDDATLVRWLIRDGVKVVAGEPVDAKDVITAIQSDLRAAQVAKMETETKLNEIEIAEKEKILVNRAEADADYISKVIVPFRTDYLALARKHGIESEVAELMAKHFKEPT